MGTQDANFRVTDKAGNVLAEIAISEHLGAFVAHVLVEYCELWVDHDNIAGDFKPASWYISVEGDIAVPVWRRLPLDDAYRRAAMHAERRARERNAETFVSLQTLNRSVSSRIINGTGVNPGASK